MDRDRTQDPTSPLYDQVHPEDESYYRELDEQAARRRRSGPSPHRSFYANEAHNLLGARQEDVSSVARFEFRLRLYGQYGFTFIAIFVVPYYLLTIGMMHPLWALVPVVVGAIAFVQAEGYRRLLSSGKDEASGQLPEIRSKTEKPRRIEPRL